MKYRAAFALGLLLAAACFAVPAYADAPGIGSQAPLFDAASTTGSVRLADLLGRGNVVLAFYFKDFTPV